MRQTRFISLLFMLAAITGCGHRPHIRPEVFLEKTISSYQSYQSYSTNVEWTAKAGKVKLGETRSFDFNGPNRYKINSTHDNNLYQISVSDGSQITEYSNGPGSVGQIYTPPSDFYKIDTPYFKDNIACGSPLYSFLGGVDGVKALLGDSKIRYGTGDNIDHTPCASIVLDSYGSFGRTEIFIGTKDYLIRRIVYEPKPINLDAAKKSYPIFTYLPDQPISTITETYHQIKTNQLIAEKVFDTKLPDTMPDLKPVQTANSDEQPPLAIGSPCPDFTVTNVYSGSKVNISSFRGKVVLLDFWATWCPPCRKSLPETQRLNETYKNGGLIVMAIDDEDAETIKTFLKKNRYTFPAYIDSGGKTGALFKVQGIPSFIIIDKSGKIADYKVGLHEPPAVENALKKAGL